MQSTELTKIGDALAPVLAQIINNKYGSVSFDFGGTLYDFTPLHIRAFLTALEIEEPSNNGSLVEDAVRGALAKGLDSFEMMKLIAEVLHLPKDLDLKRVVVRKRLIIEDSLRNASFDDFVSNFLVEAMKLSQVSVISLGLVRSMRRVIRQSLGPRAEQVLIYGRHSPTERLSKAQLLTQAIKDAGVPLKLAAYVGDAEVDKAIAENLGIDYIGVSPFSK